MKRHSRKILVLIVVMAFVFTAAQAEALDTVVGETEVRLEAERENIRTRETTLGNLIADIMREKSGADVAITNGGGIRHSVPAGDITLEDVLEIHPFENELVTVELTGAEIIEVIEHGVSQWPDDWGGFPHVSNLRFSFNPLNEPGQRVHQVWYEGEEIDPEATFVVATNDFLAEGGDDYPVFGDKDRIETFEALDRVIIDYLGEHSPVSPRIEGRIIGTFK